MARRATVLGIEDLPRLVFEQNPLKVVVAQLRFPPIFAIATPSGISGFQELIRESYPLADPASQEVRFEAGPSSATAFPPQQAPWRFRSESGEWIVAVASDSLSLETTAYPRFRVFRQKLEEVFQAAERTIKIVRQDRIGLRYINEIDHPDAVTLSDWKEFIDTDLLGSPGGEVIQEKIVQSLHQIHVRGDDGGRITIRHGYLRDEDKSQYVLDFDAYDETEVSFTVDAALERLTTFNKNIWVLFRKSITDKLVQHLGPREEE